MNIQNQIFLRNLYYQNFFVNVFGLCKNNRYQPINPISTYFLYIIPFFISSYIARLFGYSFIYKTENLYLISNCGQNHIMPIILKFDMIGNNNIESVTSIIKYYNASIPFSFFIKNNKLNMYQNCNIKYMSKGKMIEKTINIYDSLNLPIYQLFE